LPKVKVSVAPLPLNVGVGAPLGTADVDHLNVGCVASAFPNWSKPWATSDWLAVDTVSDVEGLTTAPVGVVTLMLVKVGVTLTVRLLVTERPLGSTIFTLRPYVPTLVNVDTVFAAALLPLALKVADPPAGSLVSDQL
jgi:hypothetical protein